MANAYTPGLKVTGASRIQKRRRLPILGEVLVNLGDVLTPEMPVAKAMIPGNPQTINISNALSCEAEDIELYMVKKQGDPVKKGEPIAVQKSFISAIFGDRFASKCESPVDGVLEHVSAVTGQAIVREPAMPIQVMAYINGTVSEILDREGVVIETSGAFIQGIFGVGGERDGILKVVVDSGEEILTAEKIDASCEGKIIIGGSLMTGPAIRKAHEVGARGIVAGGVIDKDLVEYLGFDIGVAVTGHENIPITLIVTEGFGNIPMAHKTYDLLKSLDGMHASINGATQIRAGVMRPEIIVPDDSVVVQEGAVNDGEMEAGTLIRCIREPYFGQLAEVVDLPPELRVVETGARVRIMNIKLRNTGEVVTVPRANVELIEE
ncbi:MAG: hypothetical protein FWE76_03225 [Symbiobacteriaceae bacterium]|nr:hypothetical protein [Symbiobacteriaceae bacterium]